jgi:type II secretory pathway component PulF
MQQFFYDAADELGNRFEGSLVADDMMAAAEQVRSMGYKPLRVQLIEEPVALHAMPEPGPYGARQAPVFDLTQTVTDYPEAANALMGAPTASDSEVTAEFERLEPWQRGGPVARVEAAPTLQGVSLGTTQPMAATAPPSATERMAAEGLFERGREVRRVGGDPGLWQRFLERIVYPIRSGVVVKDLAPYYRQFATLINAGLPLYQTLMALEANTTNAKLKEVTRVGQEHVSNGGRFSDVMAAYPWIFPVMHIEMVRAAEMGGMLDQMLIQLAGYTDHELAMRRLINGETLYPKLVLFAALMMLGGRFFETGVPAVSRLILGGMGKDTYGMAEYLQDTIGFGLMLAIPIVALVIVYRLFFFNVKGFREAYDGFKTSIPGLGNIVKTFAVAKFTRTFAALYRAGFSMSSTLRISGDACGNALLRNAAYDAVPQVERGGLVSDALARSRFLPEVAVNMFRTGETTGGMDEILDKISEYYEEEGKLKARQVAMLFSVVVLLLVGILVGFAVIRFYMGMAPNVSGGSGE